MRDVERILVVLASRLLEYPNEQLVTETRKLQELFSEELQSAKWSKALWSSYEKLLALEEIKWQELYVDTFDYKEKTGLYLTAHEFGESRKRGMALIELQKLVEELGFERKDNELTDYIPMLLELVALAPISETEGLRKRLAFAIGQIHKNLPEENPYSAILGLMLEFVFVAPKESEMNEIIGLWEGPDLDTMPYPLFYQ